MRIDPAKNIEIFSERLVLKVVDPSFAGLILEYYSRNKDFFAISMPDVSDKFYTINYQIDRCWKEYELMRQQRHIRLYVFEKQDIDFTRIIGDITISDILWGAFLSCSIGYKIDKNFTRKGYATESIIASVNYAFDILKLERIVAHIKKENIPSINLIEKIGFKEEGISRQYIKLAGIRKDHLRYSLVKGDKLRE